MIISKYVDVNAMNINEITDNFSEYCDFVDGTKISQETRKEIIEICEKYPIVRILCRAMYSQGYNVF